MDTDRFDAAAEHLARLASERGLTVAVAESLTCGLVSSALGAAPDSVDWFRGGVVAYASEVKFSVLGVPWGPVVSATAAEAMAAGVRGLLGADLGLALTGVGGPGPEDGVAAGTVWIAASHAGAGRRAHLQVEGPPEVVLATATHRVLLATSLLEETGGGARQD